MPAVEKMVASGDVSGAAHEVSREGYKDPSNLKSLKQFSLLVLRQGLKEKDPYERCYAAAALAEGGEGSGIPVLKAAFDAPETTLRMAAIDGLSEINDTASKALLKKLYNSASLVDKRVLLDALGRSGDPEVTGLLFEATTSSDQVTRLTAVRALGKSRDRSLGPKMHELLAQNHDPLEAAEISRAMFEQGDSSAMNETKYLAHYPSRPEVRAIAALALGDARDRSVVPELTKMMADPDADVRLATAVALTNYADRQAVKYLVASIASDDSLTRQHLGQLLEIVNFDNGREVFLAALASPDENLEIWATRAIGLHGGESEVAVLQESLRNTKDPMMRAGVAWAFGRIARPACIPVLMAMIPEADPAVRYTAADALGRTASGLLEKRPVEKDI